MKASNAGHMAICIADGHHGRCRPPDSPRQPDSVLWQRSAVIILQHCYCTSRTRSNKAGTA